MVVSVVGFPAVGVHREVGKEFKMNCPRCKTVDLKKDKPKNSDLMLDYCSKCGGIWFDETELEQIVTQAIRDLALPEKAVKLSRVCPKCKKYLYEFNYPQTYVKIDMCKECKGIWFDAGELKEMQAVRRHLTESGKAKEYDDVTGVKGKLLDLIDLAFDRLKLW